MSVKVIAVIKRESTVDSKNPPSKVYLASLSVRREDGKEYGLPRYFGGFEEVGDLLKREAGVTHEQLQDRFPRYQRGDEVRIFLTLESEEAIRNLGFEPRGT